MRTLEDDPSGFLVIFAAQVLKLENYLLKVEHWPTIHWVFLLFSLHKFLNLEISRLNVNIDRRYIWLSCYVRCTIVYTLILAI